MRYFSFVLILLTALLAGCATSDNIVNESQEDRLKMRDDKQHVFMWKLFVDNTLALHKKLIKLEPYKVTKTLGGYANNKNYYVQEEYKSVKTGKVISVLQWEKTNPNVLHSIEVFVRDKQGRVIRDFTAAYLPYHYNAPVQTLLSLHYYNDNLHGFRSFDASGDKLLERCSGNYQGTPYEFSLDEDDMYSAFLKGNPIEEKMYDRCLGKLQNNAGKYLRPQ